MSNPSAAKAIESIIILSRHLDVEMLDKLIAIDSELIEGADLESRQQNVRIYIILKELAKETSNDENEINSRQTTPIQYRD